MKVEGLQNLDKELKLLIGLLISCILFDWFAINSGLWCIKDRGWRQPWSLWIPYTHLVGDGGRTSIRCCESGLVLTLILSSSFVRGMRHSVWNNTFSQREVMDDLSFQVQKGEVQPWSAGAISVILHFGILIVELMFYTW